MRPYVRVYLQSLRRSESLKLEVNFRFINCKFNNYTDNYAKAKKDLLFGMKHGYLTLRIKAFVLLFMLKSKQIRGLGKL
jgi:hypothetical protein